MKKNSTAKRSILLLVSILAFNSNAQTKPQNGRKIFGKTIEQINPENGLVRCVSTEYEESLQEKNSERANNKAFEQWLAPKIQAAKAKRVASGNTTNSSSVLITIPVVVHVIHNGDAIGTNENISDARVISQITVLNQDFRKMLDTPGYNTNAVGADVEIQFCLAQTDPEGLATTGINRVNLGIASWATEASVESTLKPQTQWDPTRYFNIWVCQFSSSSSAELYGILGYAQFPSSSGLSGLEIDGGSANTDGVIIDYRCFGSSAIANTGTYYDTYNQGRTATHEIGHCFGLRHIWGDSSTCSVDDYCADTPQANTAHYGCETGSDTCTSDPGNDMVENYMDYSDDSCMNIFTLNQKDRIQAVMQYSPRRASLATSTACNTAQIYQNDGSLNITNLNTLACSTSFSPSLTLKNIGTSTMTSAVIAYNVDGGTSSNYTWTGSLANGSSTALTLPAITTTSGTHTLNVSISNVNGVADGYSENSTKSSSFTIDNIYNTTQVTLTLQRDIYGSETSWVLKNGAGTTLYSGGSYSNTSSLPAVLTQVFTVQTGECYTFTISDSYGDGFCCTYGNGYYNLKTSDNVVIVSGGSFGTEEIKKFGIDTNLTSSSLEALNEIVLYPNPTKGILNISVSDSSLLPDDYTIYNNLGQILAQKKVSSQNDLSINTERFSTGIYIIRLTKDSQSKTMQFIKN